MTATEADLFSGGFAEPPTDAAAAFRTILLAMASPGQVHTLPVTAEGPPALSPAAATVLLTMADHDTPVWLGPGQAVVAPWLAFFAGARTTPARDRAVLALGEWPALLPLGSWPAGTPDYPDRSATLVVEVPALEGGGALRLTGPGLWEPREFAPVLGPGAAAALSENAARFPLGVDLILTCGERLAALPRSTRIAEG